MRNTYLKALKKISKYAPVKYHENFANYSSLKATFFVKAIIEPKCVKNLIRIIKILNKNDIKYNFFTYGTNSYVTDDNLVLINIANIKKINKKKHKCIIVSANQKMAFLSSYYKKKYIDTFIGGTLIPGSVGAGIKINASVGDISINKYLKKVYVITKKGRKRSISYNKIKFGYRYSNINKDYIIYKAKYNVHYDYQIVDRYLDILSKRINQPNGNSLGSVFLNTSSYKVGKLIDSCDLKGLYYKGFKISNIHANFILNVDNGSTLDFDDFIFIIKLIVLLKTNHKIKEEVTKL